MADIREYTKLRKIKDNISADIDDNALFDKTIRNHRIIKRIAIIAIACLAVIAVFYILHRINDKSAYTSTNIDWSMNREEGSVASYIEYGDGFLKYSSDGITCFDKKGQSLWTHTYSIKKPAIDICGDKIAVSDIHGTTICVFDKKGYVNTVDTALVISQVKVSANGLVVAALEDETANYITMFDKNGDKIYNIKTTLAGDGYPMDIDLTSDGVKLMASYLYISGDTIKTNVVFYNFSEVGQNETERLVGGFNHYGSTIVPKVEFVTDKCAIAIGDNVISIYSMGEYPKLVHEIPIENEIEKVIYNENNIGVVTRNTSGDKEYTLTVYGLSNKSTSTNKKFSYSFNENYNSIKFDDDSVVMYNASIMTILNLSGDVLYNNNLDMTIENILTMGSRGKYYLIGSKYIQKIQFK